MVQSANGVASAMGMVRGRGRERFWATSVRAAWCMSRRGHFSHAEPCCACRLCAVWAGTECERHRVQVGKDMSMEA